MFNSKYRYRRAFFLQNNKTAQIFLFIFLALHVLQTCSFAALIMTLFPNGSGFGVSHCEIKWFRTDFRKHNRSRQAKAHNVQGLKVTSVTDVSVITPSDVLWRPCIDGSELFLVYVDAMAVF